MQELELVEGSVGTMPDEGKKKTLLTRSLKEAWYLGYLRLEKFKSASCMQHLKHPGMLKKILILTFVLSLYACYFQTHRISTLDDRIAKETLRGTKVEVDSKIDAFNDKLNRFFRDAETSVHVISDLLNAENPDFKQLIPTMTQTLEKNQCTAIGTHFADEYNKKVLKKHFREYTYSDPHKTLYSPFFTKAGRDTTTFPYDYTDTGPDSKNNGWYSETIKEGSWFGPYFGSANKAFLISYRSPFRWDETRGRNLGNVCADYSLEHLQENVAGIRLLSSGYGIVLTDDGTIISHPVKEYLARNIEEIENLSLNMKQINEMHENQFHDLSAVNDSSEKTEGLREKLVYRRQFSDRNWTILVVLNKDETFTRIQSGKDAEPPRSFQSIILKMKVRLVLFCALSAYIFCCVLVLESRRRAWNMSNAFSAICILTVCVIWHTHLRNVDNIGNDDIVVSNKTDLEAALNALLRENDASPEHPESPPQQPVKIRTGFFIQSIKFSSANDVFVTGYAWQKMPPEWKAKLSEGEDSSNLLNLVLPEAESSSMEVIYSDQETTRWYFEASLRQSFSYSKYPFDDEIVWIRVCTKDFYNGSVTLVPDFDAYPDFERNPVNGLEQDIFVEGWSIRKTFYAFRSSDYSSNFGRDAPFRTLDNQPSLYFNVSIRREFLGVFVAYMIPLVVIAFLLFAVLMIRTHDKEKNDFFGFNSAMVLGYAASLFFVLIVSHMSLRETLQAKSIIYLEYFFFCLYVAIGVVSANSIAFSYNTSNDDSRDKWSKLLYWPALLFSILIITAKRFS